MSSGPIATAVVRVIPDGALFRADLQKVITRAVNQVVIPPVKIPVVAVPVGGGAAGATAATQAAAAEAEVLGKASGKAAKGVTELSRSSQAARGAVIGLSRVTPVTVFGLGLYGTAAIAAGYAIKGAIRSTADFEHQLFVFQATTSATAEQMKLVSDEAKTLGADLTLPATSAGDAAVAMTELAKAGLSVKDTLAGAKGVLQLAAAAQLDVGSAAQFVATELNAFGLAGDQATHVADLLTGASIAAQGEIRDFGTAFQQVSAVSHQVGLSLESTTGALTELAKAGLRGADGGTSLRTTLLRLAPTTKQAEEFQKALGIQLDKNTSIGKQLPDLLDQYKKALLGLSPVLQQQALTQIFGQDAIRAASILIKGGSEALRENTAAADQNGAAARVAGANAKGLSGAFSGLQSEADTLGITLGALVSGPLERLTRGLSGIVSDTVTVSDAFITMGERINKALAGIKIPKKLGGKGLQDALGALPGDLFALTPGLGTVFAITKSEKNLIEVIRKARKNVRDEITHARGLKEQEDAGLFGVSLLPKAIGSRNASAQALGEADVLTAADIARAAATTARINALQASKRKKIVRPADITPPRDLQVDKLNAEINDSLQEELKADKAIESYFRKRLKLAVTGTLRYKQILAAEAEAHAAVASVQGEIDSNAQAAAATAKQAADDAAARATEQANIAIGNARRLADAAGNQGKAELALIALLKKRVADAKANSQELLDARLALDAEQTKQKQAIAERVKLALELQASVLDTKLERAQATPGIADDKKILQQQINAAIRDRKASQKIADQNKENVQIRLNALLKVQEDERKILSLKESIKNLVSGGGFSLGELFKEAVNQFNEFGSNVSTSPLTPGGARGAVAGGILAQAQNLTPAQKAALDEASTTNDLLSQILKAIGPPPPTVASGRRPTNDNDAGSLTAVQQRRLGHHLVIGG